MLDSDNNITDEQLDPENVRRWALRRLMSVADANLDLSRCQDLDYLATLDQVQMAKIKKITFSSGGAVTAVEPVPLMDMLKIAADIAGVKAATTTKEDDKKNKSVKLLIENRLNMPSDILGQDNEQED